MQVWRPERFSFKKMTNVRVRIKKELMDWNGKHQLRNLEKTTSRVSRAILHFPGQASGCWGLPTGRLPLGERLRYSYNIHFMFLRGGGGLRDHGVSIAAEEPADHPEPCATTSHAHRRVSDTDW